VAVVDHGRLQQVAPPQELYEQPANIFVAGFIGNPPMNLFPATLITETRLRLRLGEQSLSLPASTAEYWRQWLDAPLTAGIRPEHLSLTDQDSGLRAMVHDAEYLGHETLLYLRIDGIALTAPIMVARLPGIRIFHKGETVRLSLNTAHLHLFDTAGLALDHGIAGCDARR
jgi:ABC-type sugar transport system ATPase subunit